MQDAAGELSCYLDLKTGDILMVTDETRRQLEEIHEEHMGQEDEDDVVDIEPALAGLAIADWEKEALREANRVERDFGGRYVPIPHADSDEAYRDMEDFVSTVEDEQLQGRLTQAIGHRRPFRRFKDVLEDYPEDRERWFNFSNGRIRERVLEWLEDEGIEPV